MTIKVEQYSVVNFNRLLDFNEALVAFDGVDGDDFAATTMKELFRHCGVQDIFGLQLLHKHNLLRDEERLTDIRGTASPLSFEIGANPSVWGFDSASRDLVPLEYRLGAKAVDWDSARVRRFLEVFQDALERAGLVNVLGLSLYPGDGYPGRVEFTVDRSNVNLTPDEVSTDPSHEYISNIVPD